MSTLVGIQLAGGERSDDDDGSVYSISATSEHASTSVDDMSSHYDRTSHDLEKRRQVKIGEKEEENVKDIRVVTFAFVIFSAVSVCVIVYLVAKDYDERDFELNVSTYKVILAMYKYSHPTRACLSKTIFLFPCCIFIFIVRCPRPSDSERCCMGSEV